MAWPLQMPLSLLCSEPEFLQSLGQDAQVRTGPFAGYFPTAEYGRCREFQACDI